MEKNLTVGPCGWLAGLALTAMVGWGLFGGCGGLPGEREFKAGLREFQAGRYVRARTLFEKALLRRPGSSENGKIYHYLGVACWRLGQVQQAVEAFEASRRLDPELAESSYNLAVIYFESGDPARAEPLFQEAAMMRPSDPRPLEFLAEIYARAGNWSEARRVLSVALGRAPRSARVLTAIGRVEARTDRADRALYYFLQALDQDPRYAPAVFNLGVIRLRELGQADQAADDFRNYLELIRDDVTAREGPAAEYARRALGEMSAPSFPAAAVVTTKDQPPASVVPLPKTDEELLRQAVEEARAGRLQAALNLCLELAGRAERRGDPEGQDRALVKAVRLAPDLPRAHYARGRFLAGRGQTEEALRSFKEAVRLDTRFTLAQLALAEAAVGVGELDAALVACRAAVQQEPENPDALWMLATLYDETLQIADQAARTYRDFERLFPGDPRVLRARERLKALTPPALPARSAEPSSAPGRGEAPSRSAAESLVLPTAPAPAVAGGRTGLVRRLSFKRPSAPNLAAAVQAYNRGRLYHQQGDLDRAIFFYTRALEQDDTFDLAYFNLGLVYAERREFEAAREAYQSLLELKPDQADARYNLGLLLLESGDRPGAVEQFREVLRRQPGHPASHYALGMLYAEQPGTHELARRHYRAFLAAAPADPAATAVRRWLETH